MNEFGKLIWGFAFSATGIILGWMLNQIGQWLRVRQEDKKNLRVVLFNLLETYFLFTRSDFDRLAHKIADKVHEKIPKEQQTESSRDTIRDLYSNILITYLKPDLQNDFNNIQKNYQESIKALAAIDPLTAYYLSGKSNVLSVFDSIQDLFKSIKNQYEEGQSDFEKSADQAIRIIKPSVLQSALSSLDKDIRIIALKINPWTWYKSIRAIKRIKLNQNEPLNKEIDDLLQKLELLLENSTSQRPTT